MTLLPLSELPRFLKQRIQVPADARQKSDLDSALVTLLEDFFTTPRLMLESDTVKQELLEIREWRADLVLAKLRSLLEKSSRRDIRHYCDTLNRAERSAITRKLHAAGLHHFRQNLETDLYVGIHTAISANFKMLGVVHGPFAGVPADATEAALDQLLKALRCIATQPLGVLTAFDGLFWDSKLYSIPQEFHWNSSGKTVEIDSEVLESRLRSAAIDEIPRGCPAMRARTLSGMRAIDFVQGRCLDVASAFYASTVREQS